EADLILSLDWIDLAGTLRSVFGVEPPPARIIQVSLDHVVHNGWSMDYQGLPPVDLLLAAQHESTVPAVLAALGATAEPRTPAPPPALPAPITGDRITVDDLAAALRRAAGTRAVSLTHLPLGWNGASWPFRHPLDYIGAEGGAGIGSGPGVSVGAALALRESGRLPVAVCGDGDFLMGVTALWTAVHYRIPLLFVVANNRSFYNDEVHQERVARMRARPVENKWIGQRIDDPDIDLAAMGRAQGAIGFGPVTRASGLEKILSEAIAAVKAGSVAVVDVRVEPGYTPAMTAALTRSAKAT
ncbi:MAG: thiamine pyrophosphate-binding protein, partial [Hyphomicrobiales bacterium]|nr:thiamine pyrophosphate-binding protein [Hyphomicrobiales bacterium]